jgi:hypothetical protein
VPTGISHINVNLASFDINPTDAGFTGTPPYAPLQDNNAPFPVVVPTTGHQYLEAILHNSAFQLRADIGPDSQLQQVEMLQQSCAAPSNNPPDYPAFPQMVNGVTVKYKCIEGNFIQNVPNSPLDVGFLDQTPDGNQISFNGGLTDLPKHIQMTLSDTGGQNDSALQACGPATSSVNSACVPPLVRFDQPANSTLFGNLQYGNVNDLAKLATVNNVETAVNVSEIPNPGSSSNPWNDWVEPSNMSGDGVRAKLGINKGNISANVGIQMAVPQSLTLDQPLGWSQSVSSDQADYWQASDTKIHFIVRDANGNPVGSLGEGAVMVNDFDDGYQILAGNPCTSISLSVRGANPQNCPDFKFGYPLPGEVGVAMYRRDNSGQGKNYMQIDGRVSRGSAPLNLGVRLLATGEQAAIGRLEGQILDVPTTSDVSGIGPDDPTFRLQEEMVGNGSAPPTGGQNPTPSGETTQSACPSAFFCAQVDAKIASVFAKFDFQPAGGAPARLVQAVINQVGSTEQGMEVAGFQGLTDTSAAAPITADGFVDINPLNIYIDAGIPLLAGADVALQSEIQATFGINDSTDFYVRENLLHIETASLDQNHVGNPSQVGPLNVYIYLLHAEADLLFVPLLTIDFVPTSIGPVDPIPGPPAGPAQLATVDCSNFGTALATGILQPSLPGNTITPSTDLNNPTNLLIWPFSGPPTEPRFIVGGVLGPVFDVVQHFASPFFCLEGAGASDIQLRGGANAYPSDPVGGLSTSPPATTPLVSTSHGVPGATLDPTINPSTPPPAPITPQPIKPPKAVTISSPVALCGEHDFGDLTISAKVTVATSVPNPNPDYQGSGLTCPSGSEGTLTIVTPGHKVTITAGGSIDASGINSSQQPLHPPAGDAGPSSTASGNGGGGHGGNGGPGTTGGGGAAFGNTSGSDATTEGGVAGSSVGGGGGAGNGGGSIKILADTVEIDGGAAIVANGADGAAGTAACAGADTAGGGAGSGGGISISAVEVDNSGTIAANGGTGGNSGISPGGGGGAGIVKEIAPIVTGNPLQSGGGGPGGIPGAGTGSCPSSTGAGGGGNFSSAASSNLSSQAQPVLDSNGAPKFWNQENTNPATASQPDLPAPLSVPYQSAAASGGSGSLQTFLCAAYLSQSDYNTAKTAHPNATLDQLFNMPSNGAGVYLLGGLIPYVAPCGNNGSVVISPPNAVLGQTSFNQNRVNGDFTVGQFSNSTSFVAGAFTGAKLPDGYYGLYTVAAVPSTPNKSCSDPTNGCTFEALPANVQTVIGIDNGPPSLGFTVNGSNTTFETASQKVQLNITASANQQLSGLALVQCSNDGTKFTNCGPQGPYQWNLANGADGSRTVYVEAVNGAGSVVEQQVAGLLDTTAPTATANVTGGVLVNGWYRVPPSITLNASDATTGLNSAEAFAYRFDDGTEHPLGSDPTCPGPSPNPISSFPVLIPNLLPASCPIPQSIINNLSDGTHTLYYTAIDAVGNRLGPDDDKGNPDPGKQAMMSLTIQIDHTKPQSALLTVPAAPDGNNGWFASRPWVVVSAIDQVGGSGLVPNLGDNPTAGISYYLDGTLHAAPAAPSAPLPPFQLTDGQHDVCWFAQDRAGNFDVSGTGGNPPTTGQLGAAGQCQHFMVDSQAPTTTISLAPATPNGSGGWYTSPVPLTVNSVDPTPGSGVALVDPHDLCGPPTTPPSGASGTCVSIDHAAFEPYLSTFTIPEGTHDVRAFSIDAAGHMSAMVDQPINVDLSPPVAAAVLVPAASAQNGWWRSAPFPGDPGDSPPQVVLRAVDGAQNSGVAHLQYQLNPSASSPWIEYTGPFSVPEGVNTVNYRAIDTAGLIEPTQTLTIPVDVTPPVVTATSPAVGIWLQILDILGNILGLSPPQNQLRWTVSDNLSPHVHITVLVFNVAGAVVRQLDGGTYNTTPGVTLSGSTPWDGHDYTITGLVPIGLYYYRVVATDDAGNVAQSGESAPIMIKVSL